MLAMYGSSVQVDERLRRIERLQERAGVVPEDVRHITGGELGLDQVVAFGAAGTALDVDGDVRVLRRVGLGEGLGELLVRLRIVDQVFQRDRRGRRFGRRRRSDGRSGCRSGRGGRARRRRFPRRCRP